MAANVSLEDRLRLAMRPYAADARYLVGVSGGRDSVALLHALQAIGCRRLIVCHLDHGLRGKSARADARWVERLAQRRSLPSIVERADVAALARASKQSIETAARDARRLFFANVARRTRCRTLFLAHHADDQVETFLFNLFRGSGARGLGGMRMESVIPPPPGSRSRAELKIVRPMLGIWREEIDAYIQGEGLAFREDASNADPAHTRNRLRAKIIPDLEAAFGRNIRRSIWRAADLLGAENDWLTELTRTESSPTVELPLGALRGQPVAKQRRTLRFWLLGVGAANIGYDEIEAVLSLLDPAAGPARINLPGGWHVRRRAGVLFVETAASAKTRRR